MTRPRKPVVGHKPLSYNKLTNFPLNHLFDAYVPYGNNTYSTPAIIYFLKISSYSIIFSLKSDPDKKTSSNIYGLHFSKCGHL